MELYNKLIETGYLDIQGDTKIIFNDNAFYTVNLLIKEVKEINYIELKEIFKTIEELERN